MDKKRLLILFLTLVSWNVFSQNINEVKRVELGNSQLSFDVYFVDLDASDVVFYHKDDKGNKIRNINNLKTFAKKQGNQLVFATNGGMYNRDRTPQGIYIEDGIEQYPLNLEKGGKVFTNFYNIPPNGVFYIKKNNTYGIVPRGAFNTIKGVKYATQSGPMLVFNGEINKKFDKKSKSTYIRNGIGISKKNGINGKYEMIFAISNKPVTFYDFARIFQFYACEQALYLDGAISEMYFSEKITHIHRQDKRHSLPQPKKRPPTANDFAIIIGITQKQ